jgi:hypothetical protein
LHLCKSNDGLDGNSQSKIRSGYFDFPQSISNLDTISINIHHKWSAETVTIDRQKFELQKLSSSASSFRWFSGIR